MIRCVWIRRLQIRRLPHGQRRRRRLRAGRHRQRDERTRERAEASHCAMNEPLSLFGGAPLPKFSRGSIGLQWAHPERVPGRKIEFRNLKIKSL